MTSPIGKILLAKLPKDIVQFCIEPYLMISEAQAKENYDKVARWIEHSVKCHGIIRIAENGRPFITPIHEVADGDQQWQKEMLRRARLRRKTPSKKKQCCTIL